MRVLTRPIVYSLLLFITMLILMEATTREQMSNLDIATAVGAIAGGVLAILGLVWTACSIARSRFAMFKVRFTERIGGREKGFLELKVGNGTTILSLRPREGIELLHLYPSLRRPRLFHLLGRPIEATKAIVWLGDSPGIPRIYIPAVQLPGGDRYSEELHYQVESANKLILNLEIRYKGDRVSRRDVRIQVRVSNV